MTDILGYAVGAVFAVWFVVAVAATIRPSSPYVKPYDAADLLQTWDLFDKPRSVDLLLLRRDILRDGTLTSWREVEVAGPRRWWNFLWNPDLRPRRAFVGFAQQLIRATQALDADRVESPGVEGTTGSIAAMTSIPYLALLNLVSAQSHAAVDATQFMLMTARDLAITGRYDAAKPGRIAFVSEFHRVPAGTR